MRRKYRKRLKAAKKAQEEAEAARNKYEKLAFRAEKAYLKAMGLAQLIDGEITSIGASLSKIVTLKGHEFDREIRRLKEDGCK